MRRATTVATHSPKQGLTTSDLSGTARSQIEFSLNLLRIASPGVPTGKHPSDGSSAGITALEELLASIDLAGPWVKPMDQTH